MSELFAVYSSTKFDDGEQYTQALESVRLSRKDADQDAELIKAVTGRTTWVEVRVTET